MQITEEQKQILSSLTRERLASNPANLRDIEAFYNSKNGSLEHTLKVLPLQKMKRTALPIIL